MEHIVGPSQTAVDVAHYIGALGVFLNTLLISWLVHRRYKADKRTTKHWGQTGFCGECGAELEAEERRTKGER
jgi:hypothetical protein